MRKNKFIFVMLLLVCITLVSYGSTMLYLKVNNSASNVDDFVIMTSCNPMYIATRNVAADIPGVTVENLSQPTTGCLHDYSLTAEDMKNLSHADVLVINGLGMEGYLDDVMTAYPDLPIINSAETYTILADEDGESNISYSDLMDENSHCWMSQYVFECQVMTIGQELSQLDKEHGIQYINNATDYIEKIGEYLNTDISELKSKTEGQNVVLLHEAYEYIAADLSMSVVDVMDLDEERQVSAGEVSDLLDSIRENDVKLVFAERDYGQQMGNLIEEQTDAKVVYLQTLIHGSYDADDYQEIMSDNYELIEQAL